MARGVQTFILDPTCPVLPRPGGTIQIGWAPRRAVIVRPSDVAPAEAVLELLRCLADELTWEQIQDLHCANHFRDISTVRTLIDELADVGALVSRTRGADASMPTIRICGRGPLADGLARALAHSAVRMQRGGTRAGHETSWRDIDLVVLADSLIADPRLLRQLTAASVPHLAVRARDGIGLIGPMVLPGLTSCLECADRHRRDRDEQWPVVAAQLVGTVGVAPPATVLGTVAVALAQIDRVLAAIRGHTPEPLATLDTTLELDLSTHSLTARHWTAHPLCNCGAYFAVS